MVCVCSCLCVVTARCSNSGSVGRRAVWANDVLFLFCEGPCNTFFFLFQVFLFDLILNRANFFALIFVRNFDLQPLLCSGSLVNKKETMATAAPSILATSGGGPAVASTGDPFMDAVIVTYRSSGLGIWGTVIRAVGMPLEKIALNANSAQVSGSGQFSQAIKITFEKGLLAPFSVLTPRSGIAWFLQYSIMGFTFQIADRTLSKFLNVDVFEVAHLRKEDNDETEVEMESNDGNGSNSLACEGVQHDVQRDLSYNLRFASKMILAPLMATSFESLVSNKAEGIRFYGPDKFAKIEGKNFGNMLHKYTGPAYGANVGRNFLMCSSAFVATPFVFGKLPEEYKTSTNLFWFGLFGNWTANLAAVQVRRKNKY